METKFQTSFIPKKTMAPIGLTGVSKTPTKKSASIFMLLSVLIFVISLGAVGGAFFWKQYLINAQQTYKTQLAEREKQFNIDLIQQLKEENVKIDLAKQLLNSHLAISQIFDIISKFTIQNVRFMSLDLTGPTQSNSGVTLSMKGYGTSLQAVAFQSDVFAELEQYGLRNIVKNPIMSDPSLDTNGTVSFGFSATVNPVSLSYERSVNASVGTSTSMNQ